LREVFIGVMGHDLRTPLNAVAMLAQLLMESGLNKDHLQLVRQIDSSVSRMAELIDDTLDFTRGRLGGGIQLDACPPAPVEPVLQQAIQEVRVIWPDRQIETHFDLREPVQHDSPRLAQLFTNLLTNALAYGQADKPVVIRANSRGGKFEPSVANAGEPIAPEVLQNLFEPFSRGVSKQNKKGLGLGLYIASQIAKAHGGSLQASSTPEETRFTFMVDFNVGSQIGAVKAAS
jgi:sigma-B regulation protein RsbU (phosphoserine phosphatase)